MKATGLAEAQENGWRYIAITLIDPIPQPPRSPAKPPAPKPLSRCRFYHITSVILGQVTFRVIITRNPGNPSDEY
jgi:hypothetical protein